MASESLVGKLLEQRYLVTGLLARGGMSTVYRGMDTRLERPVAIKVLHQQYAAERSWTERFEREARAAAKLHHPNVVAVHDQGVDHTGDEAHAFLVMELVDGGTLRDLLDRRASLPPALALTVTEQLLQALAAAHRAGLVHRDVKPENLLIGRGASHGETTGGIVKVADFGLVRAIASAGTTSSSVILGTVAYLSPEQVETGAATERSDVYSAGLLLYEMLTGKPAFTGDTALSVAYQHVNNDVPAPSATDPAIPRALDDLVLRATRRDPAQRPADAGAFLAELRRVRDDLGIAAARLPVVPGPERGGSPDATLPAMAPIDDGAPRSTRPNTSAHAGLRAYDDEEPPARRRPRRIAAWALGLLLLAALVAGGAWLFVIGGKVTVPDVRDMTKARAEQVLADNELTATVERTRHDSVAVDRAIGTDPEAGTEIDRGDKVVLYISLGRPVVPDIQPGTPPGQAVAAIEKQQLTATHDTRLDGYHDTAAEGTVRTVAPEPGARLKIGDEVRYGLSKGPPPTPIPRVRGLSEGDAVSKLREAGFEPYVAGEEFNADIAAGDVVRTAPAEGEPLKDGARVGVYVSNAVDVPDVRGERLRTARQTLRDAGLKVRVVDGNENFPFAFVVSQDPEGGRIEPGGTVRLTVFP